MKALDFGMTPSNPVYDPQHSPLIYTSARRAGRRRHGDHANILANLDHFSYWMDTRSGVYLHAHRFFTLLISTMFAAPAFGARQVTIPKFSRKVSELVQRERVTTHACADDAEPADADSRAKPYD